MLNRYCACAISRDLYPYLQFKYIFQFFTPTLPIHHVTVVSFRWRIRGVMSQKQWNVVFVSRGPLRPVSWTQHVGRTDNAEEGKLKLKYRHTNVFIMWMEICVCCTNMFCTLQNAQLTNFTAVMDAALTGVKFATTLMTAVIAPTKKTAHIHQVNILRR